MALDAPLAALERHCGLARGHGRFFLNAGAFIGLMVVSNALEEELYTNLPGFDYFKAVACLELATFAAAALLAERRSGLKTPRKAPLAFYAVLGASMALSQTLGKLANKYVNFTVSTIFKCSKALPSDDGPDGPLRQAVHAGERRGGADDGAVGVLLRRRRAPGRRRLLPGRPLRRSSRRCRSRCIARASMALSAPDNSSPSARARRRRLRLPGRAVAID